MLISKICDNDKPRERLLKFGESALSDSELLAIILRSGDLGVSVLDLSSEILSKYGGFKGLLGADVDDLMSISGVGQAKASSIKALCEISLRMQMVHSFDPVRITSPKEAYQIVRKDIFGKDKEHLLLLFLDSKSNLIAKELLSIGNDHETLINVREVFTKALLKSAYSLILVHNHPSQDLSPSKQDILLTRRIAQIGVSLGVSLVDHLIVNDETYLSLKAENLISSKKKGGENDKDSKN